MPLFENGVRGEIASSVGLPSDNDFDVNADASGTKGKKVATLRTSESLEEATEIIVEVDVLKQKRCRVAPRLILLKTMYFTFCCGQALVWPYIANYLNALGLTFKETATIFGLMPFVGLLTRPLLSFLADRTRSHKIVAIACVVAWMASYEFLLLADERESNGNITAISDVNFVSSGASVDRTFVAALMCVMLINASFAPAYALFDAMVFNLLGTNSEGYGKQRMWGTLGFMIFSVVGGFGLTHLGSVADSYWLRIHINSGFCIISIVCIAFLKVHFHKERKSADIVQTPAHPPESPLLESAGAARQAPDDNQAHMSTRRQCARLVRNCRIMAFILSIFTFGCLGGYHESYYGMFMQKALDATQGQMGLAMASATFAEIIFFFFRFIVLVAFQAFFNLGSVYIPRMLN